MKKFSLLAILAMITLVLSSCKYEEGPFISVVPKVERVTNTWIATKSIHNGVEEVGLDGFEQVQFYKEGNCDLIFDGGIFGNILYNGTWSFSTDKKSILLNLNDDATGLTSYEATWEILRLKEEEMWVKYVDGSDTYEVFFAPKP